MGVGVARPFPVLVAGEAVVVLLVVLPPAGGLPPFCSTQYEFPALREQPAAREGFCRPVRRFMLCISVALQPNGARGALT